MRLLVLFSCVCISSAVSAQPLAVSHTFVNNAVADANELNQNFTDIVTGFNEKVRSDRVAPNNTGVGYEALDASTKAFANTAIGFRALYSSVAGEENTASGFLALFANTVGNRNTANGAYALRNNT